MTVWSRKAVELTQELVRIPSTTYDELKAAEYLASRLRDIPFDTVSIDSTNNVIAEYKGAGPGPRIMFLGHHDTVHEGAHEDWTHPPFSGNVVDGMMWGRGTVDEKGGLSAALIAIEHLIETTEGQLPGDILFVSTREETSTIEARGVMSILERGIRADCCIVLEPTRLNIVLGHKGRVVSKIVVHGKAAHSSVPDQGVNAIVNMAHVLVELEGMALPTRPPLGQSTQSVGQIEGGLQPNVVPDSCIAVVDRRIVSGETPETVRQELLDVIESVRRRIPTLDADVEIQIPFNPSYIDEGEPIVSMAREACAKLGVASQIVYETFHTDGEWIVNDAHIPAIVLGPGSISQAHAVDEKVEVAELEKAAEIYYEILRKAFKL